MRPLTVRFAEKVQRSEETVCWPWQAYIDPRGYGRIERHGRSAYAHRVAWELVNGPIPDDMTIDHLCRNKVCVNVRHLELVTGEENSRRARLAEPLRMRCGRGHSMADAYRLTMPDGWRVRRRCRTCVLEREARYRAARRERSRA